MQASRRELVTPHGPRTCFGGSDLFGSRFVPLGRPGFIFRLNLQNKRSRLHSQVAESSEQAENLQDNSGKVEHQSIHRGHPLPLSRIGNGCKEGAILLAWRVRASYYSELVLRADGVHLAQIFLDLLRISRISHVGSMPFAPVSNVVSTRLAAVSDMVRTFSALRCACFT